MTQSAPTRQQAVPVCTAFCSLAPHSFVYDVYNFNCIVCDSFQHNAATVKRISCHVPGVHL